MSNLVIEHLEKTYNKGTSLPIHALNDISLELSPNQIYGLLGKNGSGKTTFIKACTNLITYEGMIYMRDSVSKKLSYMDYCAVLEGNRNIYWKLTVEENVRFFTGLRGLSFTKIKPQFEKLLHELGLWEKRNSLVETLSRGMQQKVAIICTLLSSAPLIFLDEPTLGLDIESKRQLEQFLRDNEFLAGRILLVTSHDMEFIRALSSNHLFLKNGQLSHVDLNLINKSLYTVSVFSKESIKECLGIVKANLVGDNEYELIIDAEKCSLQTLIHDFENRGIEITSVKQLNRDLENIYLDFINSDD